MLRSSCTAQTLAAAVAAPAIRAADPPIDTAAIESITGITGTMNKAENVFKINKPAKGLNRSRGSRFDQGVGARDGSSAMLRRARRSASFFDRSRTMIPSTSGVTPLRQRMLDDMRMRKLELKTQAGYLRAVGHLAAFLKAPPDTATVEDLRRFQLHMVDRGTSPITSTRRSPA